jgi:DNA-binding transcriptional regulator YiaG
MLNDEDRELRRVLFKEIRASLKLSQGELAKWFYGEDTKLTRKYVSRKETGENPVSTTEICFLRTLQVLKDEGVDLKSVEFDSNIGIAHLTKK